MNVFYATKCERGEKEEEERERERERESARKSRAMGSEQVVGLTCSRVTQRERVK